VPWTDQSRHKTNLAIVERMLGHSSGINRLADAALAREVLQQMRRQWSARCGGAHNGEEKSKPRNPRFWVVATVEAMPTATSTLALLAIEEVPLARSRRARPVIQLIAIAQPPRARGALVLGAATVRRGWRGCLPGAHF